MKKSLLTMFLAFLFLGIFFVSCEKTPDIIAPETNATGSIEKLSSLDLTEGVIGTGSVPDALKWHWRRVWVEGHHSYYGSDNINGSANSGSNREADWNFEDVSGGSFNEWTGSYPYPSPTASAYSGSYAALMSAQGATNQELKEQYLEYADIGQTVSQNDTVSVSAWMDDCLNVDAIWFGFTFRNKPATGYQQFSDTYSYPPEFTTWRRWDITKTGFTSDEGAVAFSRYTDYGVETVTASSPWPEYQTLTVDDIRLYSSAEDLPPLAHFTTTDLTLNKSVEPYILYGHITGDSETWDIENGDYVYITIYYEDPDDGLYYPATAAVGYSYDDFDENGWEVRFSEELTEECQSQSGTIRFLIGHEGQETELHINEVDDFNLSL